MLTGLIRINKSRALSVDTLDPILFNLCTPWPKSWKILISSFLYTWMWKPRPVKTLALEIQFNSIQSKNSKPRLHHPRLQADNGDGGQNKAVSD